MSLTLINGADEISRVTTGLADEKYIAYQEALITGFTMLIQARERAARIDQTKLLHGAQEQFGKVDYAAALYELEERQKVGGIQPKPQAGEGGEV